MFYRCTAVWDTNWLLRKKNLSQGLTGGARLVFHLIWKNIPSEDKEGNYISIRWLITAHQGYCDFLMLLYGTGLRPYAYKDAK